METCPTHGAIRDLECDACAEATKATRARIRAEVNRIRAEVTKTESESTSVPSAIRPTEEEL